MILSLACTQMKMSVEEAIAAATINGAHALRFAEWKGSIDIGKDADLAIFSGHPLNAFSRCEMTLIEGEPFFIREKQPSAMSTAAAAASSRPQPLVSEKGCGVPLKKAV